MVLTKSGAFAALKHLTTQPASSNLKQPAVTWCLSCTSSYSELLKGSILVFLIGSPILAPVHFPRPLLGLDGVLRDAASLVVELVKRSGPTNQLTTCSLGGRASVLSGFQRVAESNRRASPSLHSENWATPSRARQGMIKQQIAQHRAHTIGKLGRVECSDPHPDNSADS